MRLQTKPACTRKAVERILFRVGYYCCCCCCWKPSLLLSAFLSFHATRPDLTLSSLSEALPVHRPTRFYIAWYLAHESNWRAMKTQQYRRASSAAVSPNNGTKFLFLKARITQSDVSNVGFAGKDATCGTKLVRVLQVVVGRNHGNSAAFHLPPLWALNCSCRWSAQTKPRYYQTAV